MDFITDVMPGVASLMIIRLGRGSLDLLAWDLGLVFKTLFSRFRSDLSGLLVNLVIRWVKKECTYRNKKETRLDALVRCVAALKTAYCVLFTSTSNIVDVRNCITSGKCRVIKEMRGQDHPLGNFTPSAPRIFLSTHPHTPSPTLVKWFAPHLIFWRTPAP